MPGPARYKVFSGNVGPRRRTELANFQQAMKAAKGSVTKSIKRGAYSLTKEAGYVPTFLQDAGPFKKGVLGMADRMGTDAQVEKIQRMDPARLQELYRKNEIVFDVYFDYGGSDIRKDSIQPGEQNRKNVQFLIDTYERVYGEL